MKLFFHINVVLRWRYRATWWICAWDTSFSHSDNYPWSKVNGAQFEVIKLLKQNCNRKGLQEELTECSLTGKLARKDSLYSKTNYLSRSHDLRSEEIRFEMNEHEVKLAPSLSTFKCRLKYKWLLICHLFQFNCFFVLFFFYFSNMVIRCFPRPPEKQSLLVDGATVNKIFKVSKN